MGRATATGRSINVCGVWTNRTPDGRARRAPARARVTRRGRTIALVASLAATSLAPGFAWAESSAADLIREGVGLRREGKDEAALGAFERAYALDHSMRALAQMGLAEQALGKWVPAHEHLTQALATPNDPWIAKNDATLRAAVANVDEHLGRLEILGGSPNAEVRVDGVRRGKMPLPAPLVLPIGPVTVTLTGPGLVPVQRSTSVRARETTRESFDPLAEAPAPPAEHATDVARPQPAPATAPPPAEGLRVTESGRSDTTADAGVSTARASAKWIAWGGAAAALGVGLYGYARQTSATRDFNDNCGVGADGTPQPFPGSSATVDRCKSLSGQRDSGFRLEVIGFIGAAAATSAGFLLWYMEPGPASARTALAACAPEIGRGGGLAIGCRWRF